MLGRSKDEWTPFAERLQDAGATVLAVDLRGHGESRRQRQRRSARWSATSGGHRLARDAPDRPARERWQWSARRSARTGRARCGRRATVRAVALVSPSLDYRGVRLDAAVDEEAWDSSGLAGREHRGSLCAADHQGAGCRTARLREQRLSTVRGARHAPARGRCRTWPARDWWTGFEPDEVEYSESCCSRSMKAESIVFAIAGSLFGLIVGWILGSQQAFGVSASPRRRRGSRRPPPHAGDSSQPARLDETGSRRCATAPSRIRRTQSRACSSATCTSTPSATPTRSRGTRRRSRSIPTDPNVSTDLGVAYYYTNQPDRARQAVRALAGDRPEAHQDAAQPRHREGVRQAGSRRRGGGMAAGRGARA